MNDVKDKAKEDFLLNTPTISPVETSDNYAISLGLIAQFLWACVSLQLKTFYIYFPKHFSNASLALWRSVSLFAIGYYFAKKKDIEITPISRIQHKMWFFFRNIGIFIALIFWVAMNKYLRLSTCQCIAGCHPIIVLYLSIIILHEKFYIRYVAGILLCLCGACIIVLNERRPLPETVLPDLPFSYGNIAIGISLGIMQLIFNSSGSEVFM